MHSFQGFELWDHNAFVKWVPNNIFVVYNGNYPWHQHIETPGPIFLYRNSNSIEISFRSHLDSNTVIATKFCTWHDSCAVVACAKICCDLIASNVITRWSFHRIWNAGKKSLVKRAPVWNGLHLAEDIMSCISLKEKLSRSWDLKESISIGSGDVVTLDMPQPMTWI